MTFIATNTQSMSPTGTTGTGGGAVVGLRRLATGTVFRLAEPQRHWVLGASDGCELRIADDPFVSGVHCVLERRGDGALIVRDRGSKNGTRVDGNPIEGAHLRVGSHLKVGGSTLVAIGALTTPVRSALEMMRGHDPKLTTAIDQAVRIANSECSVLVVGETGTGKDLLARIVHEASRRASGPFVAVNCGAIAPQLIASELFGHERGAFTGASDARDGFFVEADGGTLFLDEIGELPLELQAHLLRALETRKVRRVGGQVERAVDVRVVSATNQTAVGTADAKLRADLYHRLATVVIGLPPLRDRMPDLPELVAGMLEELAPVHGDKHVTEEGWLALASYHWPGNVRELRHAVARAATMGGERLGPQDFFDAAGLRARLAQGTLPPPSSYDPELRVVLVDEDQGGELELPPYEALKHSAMAQALATFGSIRAAAAALGMPKSTFADKAKQWGLIGKRKHRFLRKRRGPR